MLNFQLLGALAVHSSTRPMRIKGALQQAMLIGLLTNAGKFVPTDALIDELWGPAPPRKVENALQAHVSRLRRQLSSLEPDAAGERLITHTAGYRLIVDDTELDAAAFTTGVNQLRHRADEPAAAAFRARELLSMWQGPLFGGFIGGDLCKAAAAHYQETRLSALEFMFDCELKAGGHRRIIPELRSVLIEQPYQERFQQQLMLALYRSGRQAEALDTYREMRRQLSDDLGLEPSPTMRAYEQAILEHDPVLGVRITKAGAGPLPTVERQHFAVRLQER